MRKTVDYSKSLTPKFDAVNDIIDYLGQSKYDKLVQQGIGKVTHPNQFSFYCMLAGIEGFTVLAWYDHFHGDGSFEKAVAELDEHREVEQSQ